ncbi:MAG TPA: uracil-DNA glycosylase family protein [Acholeplasmataceae bacterium]|jgi:uracil-DNA glycosylase|nr:uracil-DNA glycosylase family protein [Acholeplasmataceae bacterium]
MSNEFNKIYNEIINDSSNLKFIYKGWQPIYTVSKQSKIVIIGQAPGVKAQESGIAWNDLSGNKLRDWLGVTREEFYDTTKFALIPMDFYYPGQGKTGDLPPRRDFAEKWHKRILNELDELRLIILIGQYSQNYYLKDRGKKNLTETVKAYNEYLPLYFPLAHPSPRNIRWQIKNPWFENQVIPELKALVKSILNK